MSGHDMIRLYKQEGWELDRIHGSHHIMTRGGQTVSIPVHKGKALKRGTEASLLKVLKGGRT